MLEENLRLRKTWDEVEFLLRLKTDLKQEAGFSAAHLQALDGYR